MDFAKKELAKYGWKKGQGLGKSGSGIKEAIKPTFKNDLNGLGYDESDDKSFKWWEYTFNKAASNLVVKETEEGSEVVKTTNASRLEISTGRPKEKRKQRELIHGNFCKEGDNEEKETEQNNCDKFLTPVTDEELFKICGGRTVNKGARFGLNLKGKLNRLARQESKLSKDTSFNNLETQNMIKETYCKKVKRQKV